MVWSTLQIPAVERAQWGGMGKVVYWTEQSVRVNIAQMADTPTRSLRLSAWDCVLRVLGPHLAVRMLPIVLSAKQAG